MRVPEQILAAILRAIGPEGPACSCGAACRPARALRWHLGLRLVCRAWARVAPAVAMSLFQRARLVVPRETLAHCSPAFLASTIRTFAPSGPAPLELEIGRAKVCYPGPSAVSAIAASPDVGAVSVVCRLSRSARARVPLDHLSSVLARLLAAAKVASLSLGTEEDRCSINELMEIARVLRGPGPALDGAELARSRVRRLHVTQNPVLLWQRKGACYFAELVSLLPGLESLVIDHSVGAHYARLVAPVARLKLLDLALDGCRLPYLDPATLLPSTLQTLSLRHVPLSPAYFRRVVTAVCALERLISCDLAGTLHGAPDDACVLAITGLVNKPTVRRLDFSMNPLFTNDFPRDAQLARDMLGSATLERLAILGVCTPAHVVLAIGIALPTTRLARLELSTLVHGTAIPEYGLEWLRESTPRTCALVLA